ncbi:MAG: hypothetical protein ABIP30_15915 [Ferruginibacter sp.]
MLNRVFHIVGIAACILLLIACFMPWVHYNNINETFNGFNVSRFPTGNYYGKSGYAISFFTIIILLGMLIKKIWAKRLNLFVAAVLVAYGIRTYIIFTSALFENELVKYPAIHLIAILPFIILASSIFPNIDKKEIPE